jgi:hypothetical protein
MKHQLKIAINVLVSLFVLVLGTMQAAQADEVRLDFSVPETDVVVTAPAASSSSPTTLSNGPFVISGASQSSPSLLAMANSTDAIAQKQAEKASENRAKLIALDFGIANADSAPAPTVPRLPNQSEPSYPELTPPPVTTEVPPPPKPLPAKPPVSGVERPISKPPSAKTTKQQVTALRRAIIGQESAGKFWLVNPDSGALGYGQLLPSNVAPWTKAALGQALTPREFLANPDAQIKTIDHKLGQYLNRQLAYTGGKNQELAVRRVASTWYSGNPNLWNDPRPQYSNGRRYPSIASYTRSVWKRYLREIG